MHCGDAVTLYGAIEEILLELSMPRDDENRKSLRSYRTRCLLCTIKSLLPGRRGLTCDCFGICCGWPAEIPAIQGVIAGYFQACAETKSPAGLQASKDCIAVIGTGKDWQRLAGGRGWTAVVYLWNDGAVMSAEMQRKMGYIAIRHVKKC